jgi:hypothetical protein
MSMSLVPTIEEIMETTCVGCGWHDWAVEGGTIRVTSNELRSALESNYDPSMPAWPTMVDISSNQ